MNRAKAILIFFCSPVIVYAASTNIAYVYWGDDTLNTTYTAGETWAYATNSYEYINGTQVFGFVGETISTTTYRKATVILKSLIYSTESDNQLLYSNQLCGGSSTLSDELIIAGLSVTGRVRYFVEFTRTTISSSLGVSWTNSFFHNGQELNDLTLHSITTIGTPGDPFYRVIKEVSATVTGGHPFTVSLNVEATMNSLSGDPFRQENLSMAVAEPIFEPTSTGTYENLYTIIGMCGLVSPRSTPLTIVLNNGAINAGWFSLTSRMYQAQSTYILGNESWTNTGVSQQGSGTSNWISVSSTNILEAIRVIEKY